MHRTLVEYVDLFDVIGHDVPMDDYCGLQFWKWEQQVATPALQKLGYTVIGWREGERDSFGPLSRVCTVQLAGSEHQQRLVYG